jgi:hypothetical protein
MMPTHGLRTYPAPRGQAPWRSGLVPLTKTGRRQYWYLAALVVVLDAAILGPLIGRGSLQLLDFGDYPVGPHPSFIPSAFGFPPGITNRAPVDAALYWIFQCVQWPPLHLLPLVAVAPLACVGFARIFPARALAIGAATVLYTVNPFVYERMASGQVYVVMGYSLLPILLSLACRPLRSLVATAALGGLIFALDVALSVHYLFIAGLLLVIVVSSHLVFHEARMVRAAVGTAGFGVALTLYWLIPAMDALRTQRSPVTRLDLSVFQTVGDGLWGLILNVAGLYGFWRPGPPLVINHLSGWPFLLLAILVVVGLGLHEFWTRGGAAGQALALSLVTLAVVGALLAMGARGPTASIYTWLFAHVPGFKVMRESEKFSSLLALGYAACFGAGAEALVRLLSRNWSKTLCVCCIVAVPLTYGYTELWGFNGYAKPSVYPASWVAADDVMSPGAAAIALPWRAYLQVPWMGDRIVANPMASFFARPVISADDLEAGPIMTESRNPRSLFLQFCLSEGNRLTEFGRLLVPLGIRYVILAKVPGAQAFGWLSRQHDMRKIFSSKTIVIYENEETVRAAYEPRHSLTLRNWGEVVALAQRQPIVSYLIRVRNARPGALVTPPLTASGPLSDGPRLVKTSRGTPVFQPVVLERLTRTVVLTAPAYAGWQLPGFRTTSQFGVTVAFTRGRGLRHQARLAATYGPWRLVEVWDIVGASLVAVDVALFMIAFIRFRRARWKPCSR